MAQGDFHKGLLELKLCLLSFTYWPLTSQFSNEIDEGERLGYGHHQWPWCLRTSSQNSQSQKAGQSGEITVAGREV